MEYEFKRIGGSDYILIPAMMIKALGWDTSKKAKFEYDLQKKKITITQK